MKRRWDLVALAVVLLGPLVLAAALVVARRPDAALADALVAEAQAAEAWTWPREIHRGEPVAGTFGEALAPLIESLQKSRERLDAEALQLLAEVAMGAGPASPAIEAELAATTGAIDALLAATRRERADLPEALRPTSDPSHPWWEHAFLDVRHGARLALATGFHDPGDGAAALETCLDVLALGRDLGHGSTWLGRSVGLRIQYEAGPLCVAALGRASAETLPEAQVALERIRRAAPSLRQVQLQMDLSDRLLLYGPTLDEERLQRLPRGARAQAQSDLARPERPQGLFANLAMRDAWGEFAPLEAERLRAMELEPAERTAALEALQARAAASFNPLVAIGFLTWERNAEKADRGDALLLALEEAARLRSSRDAAPTRWRPTASGWELVLPPFGSEEQALSLQLPARYDEAMTSNAAATGSTSSTLPSTPAKTARK